MQINFSQLWKNIKMGVIADGRNRMRGGRTFAKWAICKDTSPRKKELMKDKTVLWHIGEEEGAKADHFEMSGKKASAILSYGKDKHGSLLLFRHISYPWKRVKPNLTFSTLRKNYSEAVRMFLEDTEIKGENPKEIKLRGLLYIESDFMGGAKIVRTFSVSPDYPALIEKIEVTNLTKENTTFTAREKRGVIKKDKSPRLIGGGVEYGSRLTDGNGDFRSNRKTEVTKLLVPGATAVCYVIHYATPLNSVLNFNAEKEMKERKKFIDTIFKSINISFGDDVLDAQFSHCLLRGSESIFETEKGLLHSPGGGNFYAGIWANDQCEYANPFFPYLSYKPAYEQAINCYRLYENYIMKGECAPASIIGGGITVFTPIGDRGDTEMFLYGVTRFLLAAGDKALAESFLPAVEKAAAFILNKKSDRGVIFSDSDELEGRFPTGSYNLSTNCLAYDGLIHTARLMRALGRDGREYDEEAKKLKDSIITYFRGEVEGYDTYRYYEGNKTLRSWICLPAIMGIFENAKETYDALFSPKMYVDNTLKTESKTAIVWDRALLYALRGAFIIRYPEARNILIDYSKSRILGSHSPYPYEAFPEGNRAQLAAESILYVRILTEGVFAIDPLSFTELIISPKCNAKITGLTFHNVTFDIEHNNGVTVLKSSNRSYPSDGKEVFDFEKMAWN